MILLSEIIQYVKVRATERIHPEDVKPKMTGRKLRIGVQWQRALKQNWNKTRTKGTPSSWSSLILFCIVSVDFWPRSTRKSASNDMTSTLRINPFRFSVTERLLPFHCPRPADTDHRYNYPPLPGTVAAAMWTNLARGYGVRQSLPAACGQCSRSPA